MSNKELLDNIKRLREMTGVGFKDCKIALDENKGDIEKSIEIFKDKLGKNSEFFSYPFGEYSIEFKKL